MNMNYNKYQAPLNSIPEVLDVCGIRFQRHIRPPFILLREFVMVGHILEHFLEHPEVMKYLRFWGRGIYSDLK